MCAPIIKRGLALTLLVNLAVLCGCAHEYLLKLNNGDQIIAVSKPKLQGTNYHWTDDSGMEHMIRQSRVVKIESISVIRPEEKPVAPAKPKRPKHWYFLWLA
jgi:hypothetical protein